MKKFRFGVNVGPSRSRAEWAEKARNLEDLGYATLTVPDHLTDFSAPMPALISAAEATRSLRVGTNVLNNDFRHPVLVAREAATIDLLTEGRLQLGLGAGYVQSEYEQAGLDFDGGGIRVERLGEAVALIKGLLRGEQVAVAGRHYRVTGHAIFPLRWTRTCDSRSHVLRCSPTGFDFGSDRGERDGWLDYPDCNVAHLSMR